MGAFRLILGTPINAVPKPWLIIPFHGVMVNGYELLQLKNRYELRGRRLRQFLGIDDDVELWIDSGGYQALKDNVNITAYHIGKLYREIDADYYISLDFPPHPKDSEDTKAQKIARSISNFIELKSMLKDIAEEGRLVPVFHVSVGVSLRLQLKAYEPHAYTAAVGGLIPYVMQLSGKGSRAKMLLFLLLMRKLWTGSLHALGIASAAIIPLLKIIGMDTGDTQTWRHKAAYGKVIVPGLGERHISGRRVRFGPAVFKDHENGLFMEYVGRAEKLFGLTLEKLIESFEARALFNAWILKEVAEKDLGYNGSSKAFSNLYSLAINLKKLDPLEIEEMLSDLLYGKPEESEAREGEYRVTVSIEKTPEEVLSTGGNNISSLQSM